MHIKDSNSGIFTEEMMFKNFGQRANAEDYGRTPKSKKKQEAEEDRQSTFGSVMLDVPPEPLNAQERLELA